MSYNPVIKLGFRWLVSGAAVVLEACKCGHKLSYTCFTEHCLYFLYLVRIGAESTPSRFRCVSPLPPPPPVRVVPSLLRWRGFARCLSAVISANTSHLSPLSTASLRASSLTR